MLPIGAVGAGLRQLVSELDIKSASRSGFDKAAVLENPEGVQDGLHAQPVISAKGANGWQTIPGTEHVGLDLVFEGIGQSQVGWQRRDGSAGGHCRWEAFCGGRYRGLEERMGV